VLGHAVNCVLVVMLDSAAARSGRPDAARGHARVRQRVPDLLRLPGHGRQLPGLPGRQPARRGGHARRPWCGPKTRGKPAFGPYLYSRAMSLGRSGVSHMALLPQRKQGREPHTHSGRCAGAPGTPGVPLTPTQQQAAAAAQAAAAQAAQQQQQVRLQPCALCAWQQPRARNTPHWCCCAATASAAACLLWRRGPRLLR